MGALFSCVTHDDFTFWTAVRCCSTLPRCSGFRCLIVASINFANTCLYAPRTSLRLPVWYTAAVAGQLSHFTPRVGCGFAGFRTTVRTYCRFAGQLRSVARTTFVPLFAFGFCTDAALLFRYAVDGTWDSWTAVSGRLHALRFACAHALLHIHIYTPTLDVDVTVGYTCLVD